MYNQTGWPFEGKNYVPELENGRILLKNFEQFASSSLSDETAVCVVTDKPGREIVDEVLDSNELESDLERITNWSNGSVYIFIHRFLVFSKSAKLPKDSKKLRVSKGSLLQIMSHMAVPLPFVAALTQLHLPARRGFTSSQASQENSTECNLWYILPVRVQYKCKDKDKSHAASTAFSNQMNPFHYLHLPDPEVDVRGSHIAVMSRYSLSSGHSFVLNMNFLDGRWSKTVEEPRKRLQEATSRASKTCLEQDPFRIHLIYYTCVTRWWTNILSSVNDQLIAYEKSLQEEIDQEVEALSTYSSVSKALHSIAAHLHRYGSELSSTEDTLIEIIVRQKDFKASLTNPRLQEVSGHTEQYMEQTASQFRQIRAFSQELEAKLQNILALLFNRIQITNDRMMVSNGEKMHSILLATQEDTKISQTIAIQSQRLAEEMKRDSVAMKTIAITTMFFLPGTSFAAFLAMPFFSQNPYLSDASKLWIWIVCTVPSTMIAFAFYTYWKRRDEKEETAAWGDKTRGHTLRIPGA